MNAHSSKESAAPSRIRLRDLRKSFGGNHVLQGVDLDLHEGESLVVLGASGSGKSVMMKCILGLMEPDSGQILIDGKEASTERGRASLEARRSFGMLFQHSALFDSLRIWENVAFGLIHAKKTPYRQAKEKAIETLGQVGLSPDVADLWPSELSGGMQKRAALARAIAPAPSVLLFDEPTTGLDPITAAIINELIVETLSNLNASALSITHDMRSARTIGDRAAMIYNGKIIWSGDSHDMDKSGNSYMDQFVHGRPESTKTTKRGDEKRR